MTIQRKFILAIVVTVIVPTATFAYVGVWYAREQLSEFIFDRVESVNTLKAKQVQEYLDAYRVSALSLSENQKVKDAFTAIGKSERPSSAFTDMILETRLTNDLDDIKLLTVDNKVIYVSRPKYQPQVGAVAEGVLRELAHSSTSGVSYSRPISDISGDELEDAEYEMYIGAPVKDKDNQTLGIVVIEADLEGMYRVITDVSGLSSTGETVLAVNDGYSALILTPLKHDPDSALTGRVAFGDINGTGIQKAVQGNNGRGDIIDYHGTPAMAVWQTLPNVNWGILTKIDTTEALEVVTQLKRFVLVAGGIWLIIVFAVFLLFSRAVLAKPLNHLADVAQQLADGQDANKVDHGLLYRHDELGTIATALHNLRRSVQHGPPTSTKDMSNATLTQHRSENYQGGKNPPEHHSGH